MLGERVSIWHLNLRHFILNTKELVTLLTTGWLIIYKIIMWFSLFTVNFLNLFLLNRCWIRSPLLISHYPLFTFLNLLSHYIDLVFFFFNFLLECEKIQGRIYVSFIAAVLDPST